MIGYGSVTNGETLEMLIAAGWGILFAPYALSSFGPQVRRFENNPPAPFCIDNGAWSAEGGDVFDPFKFLQLVGRLGRLAEFVVLPDIVGGGHESLSRSVKWLRALRGTVRRVLIPAQNGLLPADLAPFLAEDVGVFLGGDTSYKLTTLGTWGEFCRTNEYYFHVGRVNTTSRIMACGRAGADSFDGSGVSVFGNVPHSNAYLPKLEAARVAATSLNNRGSDSRQGSLFTSRGQE